MQHETLPCKQTNPVKSSTWTDRVEHITSSCTWPLLSILHIALYTWNTASHYSIKNYIDIKQYRFLLNHCYSFFDSFVQTEMHYVLWINWNCEDYSFLGENIYYEPAKKRIMILAWRYCGRCRMELKIYIFKKVWKEFINLKFLHFFHIQLYWI